LADPHASREFSGRTFFPLEGRLQEVFVMEGIWQPVKFATTNTTRPLRFLWPEPLTRLTVSSAPYMRWLRSAIIARAALSDTVSRERPEPSSVRRTARNWRVLANCGIAHRRLTPPTGVVIFSRDAVLRLYPRTKIDEGLCPCVKDTPD